MRATYDTIKRLSRRLFLGINKETNEKVGLKVFTRAEQMVFKKEFKILSSLRHCVNIIEVIDFFSKGDKYFLVTKHVEGKSLGHYHYIMHFQLPEDLAKRLIFQLASSIYHLHSNGIVHRNITLETVLVSPTPEGPKVTLHSFGNAEFASNCSGNISGSLHYLSPELIEESTRRSADDLAEKFKSSDVWALGVILFLLLTGKFPFGDGLDKKNEVITAIMRGKLELPDSAPHSARELLTRILQKDYRKRISIEEVLEHPFFVRKVHSKVSPKSEKVKPLRLPASTLEPASDSSFLSTPLEHIPEFVPSFSSSLSSPSTSSTSNSSNPSSPSTHHVELYHPKFPPAKMSKEDEEMDHRVFGNPYLNEEEEPSSDDESIPAETGPDGWTGRFFWQKP